MYFHSMLSLFSRSLDKFRRTSANFGRGWIVAYRERLVLTGIGRHRSKSGWKGRNEGASTSTWSWRRAAWASGAEPASAAEQGRRPGAGASAGLTAVAAGGSQQAHRAGPTSSTAPGPWRRRRTNRRTYHPRRPAVLPSIAVMPQLLTADGNATLAMVRNQIHGAYGHLAAMPVTLGRRPPARVNHRTICTTRRRI
jgi:hypothetical protein